MRSIIVLFLMSSAIARGAGPFQNLGFDDGNTNRLIYEPSLSDPHRGFGAVMDLLPNWQLYRGTNLLPFIGYNRDSLASGVVSLITPDRQRHVFPTTFEIEGNYALAISGTPLNREPMSLVQIGIVPNETPFLKFRSDYEPGFSVEVNGRTILPVSQVNITGRFFDLSEFAGQEVELSIVTLSRDLGSGGYLDSIAFIPEPGAYALLLLGLSVLFVIRYGLGKRVIK